jgi:flagellar basal body-associated protein FliL
VKTGLVEVKKASEYQKKARSKLCIVAIIITVLVAIGVIAVVIYVATRPKKD